MIVHWQRVGFVHGVMNTDNMSILGLTIDYGPYGWLEGYDPSWTPNTTDRQQRRYRFGQQPQIALWNLLQLANAIYPLVETPEPLEEVLNTYRTRFEERYIAMMCEKLGLRPDQEGTLSLIKDLETKLQLTETDMTIFFRQLSTIGTTTDLSDPTGWMEPLKDAFYAPAGVTDDIGRQWSAWFQSYQQRLLVDDLPQAERVAQMNRANPKYVLRNYMAQLAIDAADKGDYNLVDELYQLLKQPYAEQPEQEKWFAKRPEWARHKIGCSMLSCSS